VLARAATRGVVEALRRGRADGRAAWPRRLMHVVLNLRVGGLERVVVDLVRSLDRTRYRVEVCCLDEGGDLQREIESLGVPVTVLGMSQVGGGVVLDRLVGLMRAGGIEVVNTHNVLAHKFGALAARCAGVPVVVHTKHGRNFVGRPFEHPKIQVYGHLLSWITDRIVAVSDDARDVCRRYELVPPWKLVTIPNGVDVRRFEVAVDRPALLLELGIPADARIVGNVARFVPEKDQATLVRALARVLAAMPQAFLLLVGDGPLMDAAARLAQDLGVADRVRLAGRRRDIPPILKLLDVFALSSITEGTSISLLEAMAAGVPVVATAVGGNPALVTHGVTGLLCPSRDPEALAARILEVLRDPARSGALAAAGKARVADAFSVERAAAAYAGLYEDLLVRKGRAARES
jgi:sugar transferase (PEP-CTERM/EpsH1 system associated)